MFPSSGFFSNIPCPYFVTGDCKRPNCHFKHQIPKPLHSRHRSGNTNIASVASTSYTPTPKTRTYHAPSSTVPIAYKPTPIAQLKKRQTSTDQEPERFPSPLDEVLGQGDPGSQTNDGFDASDINQVKLCESHVDKHKDRKGDEKISKQELKELFGDDSDVAPSPGGADDDEVLVLPTPIKPTGPVVDLTLDSDDDANAEEDKSKDKTSQPDADDSTVLQYSNSLILSSHTDNSNYSSQSEKSNSNVSKKHSGKDKKSSKDKSKHKTSSNSSKQVSSADNSKQKALSTDSSKHTTTSNGSKHKTSSSSDSSKQKISTTDNSKPKTPSDTSKLKKSSHSIVDKLLNSRKPSSENGHIRQEPAELPLAVASVSQEDQCKELFDMFQRKDVPQPSSSAATHEVVIPEAESVGRKRVAREAPTGVMPKRPCVRKPVAPSPQEIMNKRYEAAKAARSNNPTESQQSTSKVDYNVTPGTTSARTYKGLERKAHVPQSKKVKQSMDRPRILPNSRGKVPTNVRQIKLDLIVDECLKLYSTEQDAYDRAKNEEESANSRASSKVIYASLTANIIKKLRDEQAAKHSSKQPLVTKVSHDTILAGKRAADITVGLKKRHLSTFTKEDMVGDLLFKKLRSYLMLPAQLEEHGFPRLDPNNPGHVIISWGGYDKIPQNKGNMRQCKRCGRDFWIDNSGEYARTEDCVYHWGKAMNKRVAGAVEKIFTCCEEKPGAEGCTISGAHVHETNKFEDLTGYMRTFAKSTTDYCGVYSLDCEMVYTAYGIEVARVTVIDDRLNVMFDSFIKPSHKVIDYNTRFSGLTEENFVGVDTTLKDVQAILLDMFQEDTILIGHSLNNDLIALKLIHDTVVDTSVVFPHKFGLPYKRALKNLMLETLNKLIQEAGAAGHDSSEDARACMELMKWKVYQDHMKDNR